MDWQAIGAISEFLAAIAVVMSLIYLSRQIRMTRQVDRIGTFQAIVNGFTQHSREFFEAKNELALRGLKDRSNLSESDRLLFDTLLGNLMNHGEMAQGMVESQLITEDEMEPLNWWLKTMIFRYPGARQWLKDSENWYPPAFLERLRNAAREGANFEMASN